MTLDMAPIFFCFVRFASKIALSDFRHISSDSNMYTDFSYQILAKTDEVLLRYTTIFLTGKKYHVRFASEIALE